MGDTMRGIDKTIKEYSKEIERLELLIETTSSNSVSLALQRKYKDYVSYLEDCKVREREMKIKKILNEK